MTGDFILYAARDAGILIISQGEINRALAQLPAETPMIDAILKKYER